MDCYSVLWQYRSLRALSSSMSILFCFSSKATRFSRHLTYSFFFRRHSRAASLEATTERLCEHESSKSYILFTGPTSCKSEMQNIIVASMETQIKSKPGKLELWVLVYVHVQRKWFHKPSFSILNIAMKQRKLSACVHTLNHNFQTQDETSMKAESRPMDATEELVRPQMRKELMERPTKTDKLLIISCKKNRLI